MKKPRIFWGWYIVTAGVDLRVRHIFRARQRWDVRAPDPHPEGILRDEKFWAIFGLTSIFFTIGMVTSPRLAGWVFDTLRSYQPVGLALSGAALAAAMIIITAPRARKGVKPAADGSESAV